MPAESEPRVWGEGELVSVLVPRPIGTLDYLVSQGVVTGSVVEVPLANSREIGVVWGPGQGGVERSRLRKINRVLDVAPLNRPMRHFLERAGAYTVTPLPIMLRLATRVPGIGDGMPVRTLFHPTGTEPAKMTPARRNVLEQFEQRGGMPATMSELIELSGAGAGVVRGLVKLGVLAQEKRPRDITYPRLDPDRPGFELTPEQRAVADNLRQGVASGIYHCTLLKGVTGSGKTEVYLEAVAECLRTDRQVLVLLPEIALTAEFIQRIEDRFGGRPGEWHSGITGTERKRLWRAAGEGKVGLVVGARSALFLPFRNLGLIIVDEENDGSYKQEEGALYNARDMAVLRASLGAARAVLVSATPSLESWHNVRTGKYSRLNLPTRIGAAELPEIMAIDLREARLDSGRWISGALAHAMRETRGNGHQSLLFLNRRGYAPLTVCRECGEQIGCSECDTRMVEHRFARRLMCHLCGRTTPIPENCPACGADGGLRTVGPGVERLADEARELFPDSRIEILSSDFSGNVAEFRQRLEIVRRGGTDIIIGTQIIAKGHNFPRLGLVGAVDADLSLHGSDLRAAERTFQLMTQVAGRAGRADLGRRGIAMLQTWQPDHPVIQAILAGNDEEFWEAEAAERQIAGAPPFGRYAGIILSGNSVSMVEEFGREMVRRCEPLRRIGAQIFGPAPAPVAKLRGRFRFRILVKAEREAPLQAALLRWKSQFRIPGSIRIVIDIDPQSFM
ncbi:MAG: primosomal protein N' [Rhodobacteraceae bacterium]|nr:primosomal protein N' [Paracoccaceae bacterium]